MENNNLMETSTPASTPQTTPPSPKKINLKKILLIVAGVSAILILVAGGSYWYALKSNTGGNNTVNPPAPNTATTSAQPNPPTPTPLTPPANTDEGTGDWKKITNSEIGVQVQYSTDWGWTASASNDPKKLISIQSKGYKVNSEGVVTDGVIINVWEPQAYSFSDRYDNALEFMSSDDFPYQDSVDNGVGLLTDLGGVKAASLDTKVWDGTTQSSEFALVYFVVFKEKLYIVEILHPAGGFPRQGEVEEILMTFKFIS